MGDTPKYVSPHQWNHDALALIYNVWITAKKGSDLRTAGRELFIKTIKEHLELFHEYEFSAHEYDTDNLMLIHEGYHEDDDL